MGMEISISAPTEVQEAATALKKWTKPCVISALTPRFTEWEPKAAKQQLLAAHIDIPTELRAANSALAPVSQDWLAKRLEVLWKSTTPTNSMQAKEWLHETGRLTKHLPRDIAAYAIDEAVRRSRFTPTAAEIHAIAAPLLSERKLQRDRLDRIVNGEAARSPRRWETEPEKPFVRCTPEQAAATIAEFGLDFGSPSSRRFGIDTSKLRTPTEAELADIASEFRAKHAI